MVPPTSTDSKIKDSSMILSGREDSSLISNVMREIKINRVQTMDNILKSERNPDKLTTKITEVKKRKDGKYKYIVIVLGCSCLRRKQVFLKDTLSHFFI